jgi:hypothetical protein
MLTTGTHQSVEPRFRLLQVGGICWIDGDLADLTAWGIKITPRGGNNERSAAAWRPGGCRGVRPDLLRGIQSDR